jgi:hypothetical protein
MQNESSRTVRKAEVFLATAMRRIGHSHEHTGSPRGTWQRPLEMKTSWCFATAR